MSYKELDDKIKEKLKEHLTELKKFCGYRSRLSDSYQYIVLKTNNCLFKWIVKTTTSPERIIDVINYLKDLDGFFDVPFFSEVVSITCFDGIARRELEVFEGPWEELLLLSSYLGDYKGIMVNKHNEEIDFECINEWFPKYCSPKLCPNPFLRLKLFRCMSRLGIHGDVNTNEAFISTLCELHDRYSSFKNQDISTYLINNLKRLMRSNLITIGNILRSDYSKTKKVMIINVVVTITKMLAVLDKQNLDRICLYFCGLITCNNYDDDIRNLANVVSNNSLMKEYIAEILSIVTARLPKLFRKCIPKATQKRNKILRSMVAAEARCLPLHLNYLPRNLISRELNGNTPQTIHKMLFFTTIKKRDYIEESYDDTLDSCDELDMIRENLQGDTSFSDDEYFSESGDDYISDYW